MRPACGFKARLYPSKKSLNAQWAYSIIQISDGGYAVAGLTASFGAGAGDFIVMKISSDGSYPECVEDCEPNVIDTTLQVASPDLTISSVSPSVSTPSPTVTDVSPSVVDICGNVGVSQGCSRSSLLVLPAPGGLTFKSQKSVNIRIYSASGRLVREVNLTQGGAFVPLRLGVYIWQAGKERGQGHGQVRL